MTSACKEATSRADDDAPLGDASVDDAGTDPARAGVAHRGTFGTVRDASSEEPIAGAVVRFFAIDPGADVVGTEQLDFAVSTVSAPAGQYTYEAPFPQGSTRVRVDAPGYTSLVVYRSHLYDQACSGGLCSRQDFALWPDAVAHETLPDLVPNPSYVAQTQAVLTNDCDGRDDVTACIRVVIGTANFGTGDLSLSAPTTDLTTVTQHVFDSNGVLRDIVLDGDFSPQEDHGHVRLDGWARVALRPIDESCDTLASAHRCPVVRELDKTTHCVGNFAVVDAEITPNRREYTCETDDGRFVQGLSAGAMDVDTLDFTGQFIDVTGLPSGDYWLETHVNPDGVIVESNYDNNVVRGRYRLTMPECGNGVPEFPEPCDGDNVRGVSCEALDDRFSGGELACNDRCGFDRSGCTRATCAPVDLGSALGILASGTNEGAYDTASPRTCSTPRGTGKDVSFTWTAPEAGVFTFRERRGNMYLYVRSDTCDGVELACELQAVAQGVDVELSANQSVVVFLDVLPDRLGQYQLEIVGPR